ncbi:HNH endonuclease signature motif containing protein [Arthrobacter nitrophenolicus]|uniref:HNH endonuclease n=1 Tax=Arthrobacter nitrophenolicus TaxID=683150 RepID=A0A4R5XXQ1_9MICC|nr:HNH endonuclease signature motif containing protein [Arthrobacter nitrophenolicus]TDL36671.1 HNH endonuclease [Arthrobacter nitrophenolicus]
MEAIGEQLAEFGSTAGTLPLVAPQHRRPFIAHDAGRRPGRLSRLPARPAPTDPVTLPAEDPLGLAAIGALLTTAAAAAPEALAAADYAEAAHYAAHIEELSRRLESLQVQSAGAVDRTRTQAIAAAAAARTSGTRTSAATTDRPGRGWMTGWDANGVETLNETDVARPASSTLQPAAAPAAGQQDPPVTSPADDGCRNTAEFLRLRLRIPIREARRRLALAHQVLPASSLTGQPVPPLRTHLAAALAPTGGEAAAPAVSSHAATIITATLDRLQHQATPEILEHIENHLTTAARTADPDFLARLARRWADTIDADGAEPSEEALRHTQGAFIRKPRHGLHHVEIFATTDQYEYLATVMNTATNPRTTTPNTSTSQTTESLTSSSQAQVPVDNPDATVDPHRDLDISLERRSRPQQQLDGLVSAVKAGLTTNQLPTTGGNRPQIIATINYQDLFPTTTAAATGTGAADADRNSAGSTTGGRASTCGASLAGTHTDGSGTRACPGQDRTPDRHGTGNFAFTGPAAATTLRKIACDADIIPAVLGTHGEILHLGRKTRLFTPAQRLALTARDQGCAFPDCTIPAPWCEAHHITYWSHGGETTTDNGVLLCSFHHHLIHKEQWAIAIQHGTPSFIPPPHIDPNQSPRQNNYFKPPPLPHLRE